MPELPEVENLRLGLQRRILGQRVRSIAVRKPKLVSGRGNLRKASPKKTREFIRGLTGSRILDITRRAKNLVFHFSGGKRLVVHLKMSGQFVYRASPKRGVKAGKEIFDGGHPIRISETVLPNPHTRLIFGLDKGILYYNDTRMFGYLLYYPSEAHLDKAGHFRNLGLEPLDAAFTPAYFRGSLRARKARLKSVLMDQAVVTGLGNIYADEVCFLAKVRTNRKASSLSDKEIGRLHRAILAILPKAIAAGGSSVVSYRLADGSRGNYAREHKVYGRAGEKCFRCRAILKEMQINNRTTVFCAKCQK